MDRRQRKTKEAIFNAFTYLLKRKPYSRITVQEIIDQADIGRTTFYSHFETKDDLIRNFCVEIFEHVFSDDLKKEATHDFSVKHDTKALAAHILYHLQDHIEFLYGLIQGDNDSLFMSYFKKQMKDRFSDLIPQESETQVPRDYYLDHIVCDFTETVRWWSAHKDYTPEEISSFLFSTSPL